ncbi:MAG: AP2 domain-containing protein [Luteolibacter sp.]
MELESDRGISRMDYESTSKGWLVRYTRDGQTYNEHVSDSKYGSPEASLDAARKLRDDLRELFPPPSWQEFLAQSNKPESGIHGVRRQGSRRDGKNASWMARWSLNGEVTSKSFSVTKYGEEQAKQMAIAVREEIEPQLEEQYNAKLWNYRTGRRFNRADVVIDPFGFEGAEKFVLHKAAERDPRIRNLKLRAFLNEHGSLYCEVCGFSFEKTYGQLGKGLIEVHHLVPIAEMEPDHKTILDELICICSNCHFTVHNGDSAENLRLMRLIFSRSKSKEEVEQAVTPNGP